MKDTTIIPARGTVEFVTYPFLFDPDGHLVDEGGEPDMHIDGPDTWLRPVVALIERIWVDEISGDGDHLPYEPVVVDQVGNLSRVHDYLESLMGGLHWDHCTHFYRPHIDGPVTDAPRIRRLDGIRRVTLTDGRAVLRRVVNVDMEHTMTETPGEIPLLSDATPSRDELAELAGVDVSEIADPFDLED